MEKKPQGKDFQKVSFNDFDLPDSAELMEKRWNLYNNGNEHNYNYIAYDTWDIRVVDVDCILEGEDNPIKNLLKTHPYRKSATKEYGRHIFVKDDIHKSVKRCKKNFDTKYGTVDGKSGVDYLNGQWGWAKMDDVIYYPKREITKVKLKSMLQSTKKKN